MEGAGWGGGAKGFGLWAPEQTMVSGFRVGSEKCKKPSLLNAGLLHAFDCGSVI